MTTTFVSMHTKSKPTCYHRNKGNIYHICVHYELAFLSCTGDEEFDELCFEFGIELDEVVSEK